MHRVVVVGVLVVSILAIGAARASTASALSPGVDIAQAIADIENGTATAMDWEEFKATVDWVASEHGVASSAVPYQTITEPDGTSVSWASDPDVAALTSDTSSAAAGGSVEAATGGELLDAGAELGFAPALETAVSAMPVVAAGVAALGAGYAIGTGIRSLYSDPVPIPDTTCAGSDLCNGVHWPTAEKKIWVKGTGTCGSGQSSYPGITSSQTYGPYGNGLVFEVPCDAPGGGVWLLQFTLQTTTSGTTGQFGTALANPEAGIANDDGCSSNYSPNFDYMYPQLPKSGRWHPQELGSLLSCHDAFQPQEAITLVSQGAYKYKMDNQVGFPHVGGSCPSPCTSVAPNPSSSWATDPAGVLDRLLGDGHHSDLKQFINSSLNVQSNGQPTPPPGGVTIPNCLGETASVCQGQLQQLGFGTITTTTVTDPAQADLTQPAGDVISTNPAGGAVVDTSTPISIELNPNPNPLAIPAPESGETYQSYIARLQSLGFTGTITETDLSDSQLDPTQGPGVAIRTLPAVGSQVWAATNVVVYANPSDATGTGGATGPIGPALPGITVPSVATPCSVFPFGIPCWIGNQLSQFNSGAVAPHFDIGMPALFGGGNLDVNLDHPFGADLSGMMAVARPVLLVLATLGLVYWLGGMAMGGSTGGGGSAGESEE